MYSDPSLIREFEARVRLNERENDLVNAIVAFTGQQKGVLLREIILAHASRVLSGQADIAYGSQFDEAAQHGRMASA